jgi:hypothetical protein
MVGAVPGGSLGALVVWIGVGAFAFWRMRANGGDEDRWYRSGRWALVLVAAGLGVAFVLYGMG